MVCRSVYKYIPIDDRDCHLSNKIYRFSDNLPRCQVILENQLSHITWRAIFFLFRCTHSPSVLTLRQDMNLTQVC